MYMSGGLAFTVCFGFSFLRLFCGFFFLFCFPLSAGLQSGSRLFGSFATSSPSCYSVAFIYSLSSATGTRRAVMRFQRSKQYEPLRLVGGASPAPAAAAGACAHWPARAVTPRTCDSVKWERRPRRALASEIT